MSGVNGFKLYLYNYTSHVIIFCIAIIFITLCLFPVCVYSIYKLCRLPSHKHLKMVATVGIIITLCITDSTPHNYSLKHMFMATNFLSSSVNTLGK